MIYKSIDHKSTNALISSITSLVHLRQSARRTDSEAITSHGKKLIDHKNAFYYSNA